MADTDISSYPKPQAHTPMLQQAKQWGELEAQNIAIGQAKLKQINDQFGLMNNELAGMANDPSITKEQAAKRLVTFAKTYGFKPEVTNHMLGELNDAKSVKEFADRALIRGQDTQQKLNQLYGGTNYINTGQTAIPVAESQMRGVVSTGAPIQLQSGPGTPVTDPEGRPRLLGPQPPQLAPGTVAQPPIASRPTERIIRGDAGVTAPSVPANNVVQSRFPQPTGAATGQSPLFAQGMQEYTKDQSEASNRASAIKNLTQAMPLINSKGFLSGPGTDAFTRGVAALKTWGLLDIDENADPTAIRQEVNKKLANYISNSPVGQRSDAAQSLKEAASPSAKVQILPALKRLVKDAVALERIQIAMPNSFTGKDYENYIQHKGTFPQSVDEKAFALDLEDDGGAKIVKEMQERLKKNPNDSKALKFKRSLEIADKQGFYR